ncbi:MAG: MarR family transcriptional regulator [Dehalococcoidales bacterium]|nr:MarR family transcriptional regulator [Dehalococcoidales bacterium]
MPSANKEQLIDELLSLADRLFRQLFHTVPQNLISLDVTMPQIKIMLLLYFHGQARMSDIAAELDVTLPTSTSLVDRLVEKNFVVRENQPDDRRVVLCRLSEAGKKAIGGIWASTRVNSQKLLEAMDTEKLRLFVEVLEAMMQIPATQNETLVSGKK